MFFDNVGGDILDPARVHAEDIQQGFENALRTFQRLFKGENLGKQLLKIADPR